MSTPTKKQKTEFPTTKPRLPDVIVDAASPESVAAAAIAIAWPTQGLTPSDCVVTDVAGGITNQRRKVKTPSGDAVFVRIFGAEGIIDRDVETATFEALSHHLGRPGFLYLQCGFTSGTSWLWC